MLALLIVILVAPLLFGMWCAFLPATVPRWVLAIPLQILGLVWKAEQRSMIDRTRDQEVLFGARPEDDWRYQRDQINAQPGLENSVLFSAPDAGRVRIIGVITLAVWMAIAVWLKSKFHG